MVTLNKQNRYKENRNIFAVLLSILLLSPTNANAAYSLPGFAATPLSTLSLQNLINTAPYLVGLLLGIIALVGLWLVGSAFFKFIKAAQQGGQVSHANAWATLAAGTLMLSFSITLDVLQNTVFATTGGLDISYVSTSTTLTHGEMVATAAIIYIQVVGVMFLGSGLYGLSRLGAQQSGQDHSTGIWKIAGGFFCINIIALSEIIFCNTLATTNPLLTVMGQSCP